jgi:hypothetical protein
MQKIQIEFIGNGNKCSAEIELEGIADSWDADARIVGHPAIKELHIKYWLGEFLRPVFSSKEEVLFFEPLLNAIEERAKLLLPKEFED